MIFRYLILKKVYSLCKKHIQKSCKIQLKRKFIIIVFLFSAFTIKIKAQNGNKNQISDYHLLAVKYMHKNYDSLIFYGKKMQISSERCIRVKGLLYEAKGYYYKGIYKKSEELINRAINLTKRNFKTCDVQNIIDSYRRLSYIYKNRDNYKESYKYLIKVKGIIDSMPNKGEYYHRVKIGIDINLSTLKVKLGLYNDAIRILKKAYIKANAIKLNNPTEESSKNLLLTKADILNSLGDIFMNLKEDSHKIVHLDSAKFYYEKGFNVAKSLSNPSTEAIYRMREINIVFEKKDYELTLFYLNRFDSILKTHSNNNSTNYYLKAISFNYLKKYDSSIYFSKKYINHFKNKKNNKNIIPIYDNLTRIYLFKNMNDSALKYSNLTLTKFKEINENRKNTSLEIYNSEFKKINLLNKKLERKNNSLSFQKIIVIICLVLLIILILILRKKKLVNNSTRKRKKIDAEIEISILQNLSKFENTNLFLDDKFNINSLAKYLNTNTTYLSTIINNHKKQSFKQYLFELRIEYLTKKLKEKKIYRQYTIKALANEIGYTNASAFTRAFKKLKGISPSEYIKKIEKKDK